MLPERTLQAVLRTPQNVALYRDLLRAATAFAVVIGIAAALLYLGAMSRVMLKLHMNDFGKFYYSARLFLDGQDMYGPNPATDIPVNVDGTSQQFWNMNPPHFHLLILPLAMLAPMQALAAWAAMNIAALLWSLRLIMRALGARLTAAGTLWSALAFLWCSATCAVVITGQVTFLLMLPFTYAWVCARRGNWDRAGIALGLLISLKPFFGIFGIYLLLVHQFRAAMLAAAAGAAVFLAGLAVFGTDSYLSWSTAVKSIAWLWAPMNGSVQSFFSRTFSPSPLFPGAFNVPSIIVPLGAIGTVFVLVLTYLRLNRGSSPAAIDHTFALLFVTALLVTPLGWVYYWWLLAGPVVAIALARGIDRWVIAAALPGLLYPPLFVSQYGALSWVAPTIGSVYFWASLAFWVFLVKDVRSRPAALRG